MRTIYCDFCHAELDPSGSAWDCPAESFDYDAPRIPLSGEGPAVEGSVGSWIACDECATYVREGMRESLLTNAILGNFGPRPVGPNDVADLSDFLDLFWVHCKGSPIEIGPGQLALIASDPETIREPRG